MATDHEIGDRRGEANALWNSALRLEKLGDRAEAALRILEAIVHPDALMMRAKSAEWRKAGAGS